MALEIEIKYPLFNADDVINTLNKGGKSLYQEHQIDYYFNPPHKNYAADKSNITEWFRVRTVDGKNSINYKDYSPKTHCIEHETKISSVEDTLNMLKATGFNNLITVDKFRQSWLVNDVEISIDNVKELGTFIELEYKGTSDDAIAVRGYLHSFLHNLNAKIGEEDNKGYPWVLLERL